MPSSPWRGPSCVDLHSSMKKGIEVPLWYSSTPPSETLSAELSLCRLWSVHGKEMVSGQTKVRGAGWDRTGNIPIIHPLAQQSFFKMVLLVVLTLSQAPSTLEILGVSLAVQFDWSFTYKKKGQAASMILTHNRSTGPCMDNLGHMQIPWDQPGLGQLF